MSVPDEAVEAAARAVYGPGFDRSHHKSAWLADFRAALEAAAPFIAAQAWDEAVGATIDYAWLMMNFDEAEPAKPVNPYRSGQ